jgi:hypothetical protein
LSGGGQIGLWLAVSTAKPVIFGGDGTGVILSEDHRMIEQGRRAKETIQDHRLGRTRKGDKVFEGWHSGL